MYELFKFYKNIEQTLKSEFLPKFNEPMGRSNSVNRRNIRYQFFIICVQTVNFFWFLMKSAKLQYIISLRNNLQQSAGFRFPIDDFLEVRSH